MTDKPILFSAPMIRALLDGRKTQTRRVVKIKDQLADHTFTGDLVDYYGNGRLGMVVEGSTLVQPIPYAPGDRLWVREAHYLTNKHAYRLSVGVDQRLNPADDYEACVFAEGFDRSTGGLRKRPSIHMPRWASRLTLIVTDVRVQRLQEISEADAKAEGVAAGRYENAPGEIEDYRSFVLSFQNLWNSLHGPDAWDANPWLVALTFDVHRCNIDQMEAA